MSFHRPTRRQLATHEAGHAYVYSALHGSDIPCGMGLGIDDDGGHRGWSTRSVLLDRDVPLHRVVDECRPTIEWQADVEVAVAIAGPMSEFRHRHRSRWAALLLAHDNVDAFLRPDAFDADGDFARIRACLAHVEEPRPAERLKEIIVLADAVLSENWPRVLGLARLLLERGRLGERNLETWFEAHPARRRRHRGHPQPGRSIIWVDGAG